MFQPIATISQSVDQHYEVAACQTHPFPLFTTSSQSLPRRSLWLWSFEFESPWKYVWDWSSWNIKIPRIATGFHYIGLYMSYAYTYMYMYHLALQKSCKTTYSP